MDKVLEYKEKVSLKLERYEKIVELEKQTGVDKFYIFVVGALLAGVLLFVIGGEELVVGLVGFIYPAYMSFKALSTPGTDDDTQWLTYWVVYAFFNLTESVTDLILSWCVLLSSPYATGRYILSLTSLFFSPWQDPVLLLLQDRFPRLGLPPEHAGLHGHLQQLHQAAHRAPRDPDRLGAQVGHGRRQDGCQQGAVSGTPAR